MREKQREINLETCTKEQLIARIGYMLRNASNDLFVHLEDKYTKNPRMLFDRDDKSCYIGKVAVFNKIDKNMNVLINTCWKNEFYEDTVESFVNDLYDNYILGVYQ